MWAYNNTQICKKICIYIFFSYIRWKSKRAIIYVFKFTENFTSSTTALPTYFIVQSTIPTIKPFFAVSAGRSGHRSTQ